MAKRTLGSVDRLPSGRYRARYRGPDGRHAKVFGTKADAWAWLATQQTVASTKVVCDGPGDQRALCVEAATA